MQKQKDIVLKKGDVIYYKDGQKCLVNPEEIQLDKGTWDTISKVERPVKYKTIYEVPKQILDKEEKEYLENFLRPFKDRVITINKYMWGESREYIRIWLSFNESIPLPLFTKDIMYKGMELGKEYTLKELGLFVEVEDDKK